jgi:hypothetical protein
MENNDVIGVGFFIAPSKDHGGDLKVYYIPIEGLNGEQVDQSMAKNYLHKILKNTFSTNSCFHSQDQLRKLAKKCIA